LNVKTKGLGGGGANELRGVKKEISTQGALGHSCQGRAGKDSDGSNHLLTPMVQTPKQLAKVCLPSKGFLSETDHSDDGDAGPGS
jgi:hypothetical protein